MEYFTGAKRVLFTISLLNGILYKQKAGLGGEGVPCRMTVSKDGQTDNANKEASLARGLIEWNERQFQCLPCALAIFSSATLVTALASSYLA
jgi:hypothetical protein